MGMPGSKPANETEVKIAAIVAGLVPDGATLQFRIGALPDSIAANLQGHQNLRLHTGILSDSALELIKCGAVGNSLKPTDAGISVTGAYMGSQHLFEFANLNKSLSMRSVMQTHGIENIAKLPRFRAINSALEVDLAGQINTECVGGKYVGTIGGAVDFTRGAQAAQGGLAIIALPSVAGSGATRQSRIALKLSGPVSIARSDACVIVTEYGVADLRGLTLRERTAKLIAIAHPDFRDLLNDGLRQ